MAENTSSNLIELASEIVAAFVANNSVPISELPALIGNVHAALREAAKGGARAAPEALQPPVPIKKLITPDYLISLEDGKRYKSLKRHLGTYNLTPDQYRAKWGLPPNYPMVAPNYAKARSELAKKVGLGQKRKRRRKGA